MKKQTRLDDTISILLGSAWKREYPFHPERKFRFDYARPDVKIAIEIQGGIWTRGKHVRGVGYENDCEKLNLAVTMGWKVLWYTPQMVMRNPQKFLGEVNLLLTT